MKTHTTFVTVTALSLLTALAPGLGFVQAMETDDALPACETEGTNNNSPAAATPLPTPHACLGTVVGGPDSDYYSLSLTAGERVAFALETTDTARPVSLFVHSGDRTTTYVKSTTGPIPLWAGGAFEVPASGTYLIHVSGFSKGGAALPYTLSIHVPSTSVMSGEGKVLLGVESGPYTMPAGLAPAVPTGENHGATTSTIPLDAPGTGFELIHITYSSLDPSGRLVAGFIVPGSKTSTVYNPEVSSVYFTASPYVQRETCWNGHVGAITCAVPPDATHLVLEGSRPVPGVQGLTPTGEVKQVTVDASFAFTEYA